MKKILTALLVLGTLTFTIFPATSAYAAAETVECNRWGKMVNGDYYKGKEGKKRLEQQRRQQQRY